MRPSTVGADLTFAKPFAAISLRSERQIQAPPGSMNTSFSDIRNGALRWDAKVRIGPLAGEGLGDIELKTRGARAF